MSGKRDLRFLWRFVREPNRQGFTLLELLFIVLFMGILAAIALPNLLSQIDKARQAEAKQMLGAMNRGQQAYRFEKAVFADSVGALNLAVTIGTANPNTYETSFFLYSIDATPGSDEVRHLAVPQPLYQKDTKKLTSAITRIPGQGDVLALCEANRVGDNPSISFTAGVPSCTDGRLLN
jgi:type IV pilus assembly protein PilA